MRLPRRDVIATVIVALAALAAGLWAADLAPPGFDGVRATALFVLACGFIASAGAVVPGFERLIRGNRWYLVVASLLGLVALTAGILVLVTEDGWWLVALVGATIVLWAMSTVRHVRSVVGPVTQPRGRLGGTPHRPAAA